MNSPKVNRIISAIWVVIAISALASIFVLIGNIHMYSQRPLLFWLTVLKLIISVILLVISFNLRKIVQSYTKANGWQEANYRKMQTMGYLTMLLIIINTFFQVGYETMWGVLTQAHLNLSFLYMFRRFYSILFTESPALWVLPLSIFLFAELLRSAHLVKAENESFI